MADIVLAQREALAHRLVVGAHGALDHGARVAISVRSDVACFAIVGRRSRLSELERSVGALGLTLPSPGKFVARGGCRLFWSGPEQWTLIGVAAEVQHLAQACSADALIVDQSDGRAVIAVSGSGARLTLAKGVPLDLHPRVFSPGMTAVTTAAGIAIQIWQVDSAPTYELAVPRSFAEDFWSWLTHAAAEYGYEVADEEPKTGMT